MLKFTEILKIDQRRVNKRLEELEKYGILEFFDRMLELLDDLITQIGAHTEKLVFPQPKSAPKQKQARWNDRLRLHMFGSSLAQFIYAFSHVCRAQVPETYMHMRRAIEAAGVAYLSKSQRNIGKIYGSKDERKLWNSIKRNKILPENDRLTVELNKMMARASSQLHSNFQSIEGRIEEDFEYEGSRVLISFSFDINDSDNSVECVWEACSYILTAMCHVAQLFAESFDLPTGSWHEQLESYKADLHEFDRLLKDRIAANPPS